MAKVIHVNGPCLISVGPQGVAGGLTELALSSDGVDLSFDLFTEDVYADSGGPRVPVDVQDMGKLAYISFRGIVYDADVLEGLMRLGAAAGNVEPPTGRLLL